MNTILHMILGMNFLSIDVNLLASIQPPGALIFLRKETRQGKRRRNNGGVHGHGGTPTWLVYENPFLKWIMIGIPPVQESSIHTYICIYIYVICNHLYIHIYIYIYIHICDNDPK